MDNKYCFVITLSNEGKTQIEFCLGALRAVYQNAPVKVINDGFTPDDKAYSEICQRFHVDYELGKYLKRIECGGKWLRRLLESGLKYNTPWIVKIDPDTKIWRQFKEEPQFDISGTVDHKGTSMENVLGGCQLIRRSAAEKILNSGLLDDSALKNHRTFEPDEDTRRHWVAIAWMGGDFSLAWLARNLGLSMGEFSEVKILWNGEPPANNDLVFAATHPHKLSKPPRFSNIPIHIITSCKGRRHHLQQTLPKWLEDGVGVTVVDYGCNQRTADWVKTNYPNVIVVHAQGLPNFNLAHARNLGAKYSPEGWWCFFDADCLCKEGWSKKVKQSLKPKTYLLARPINWGQFGSCICHSWDFRQIGGYDEFYVSWGGEDLDFYLRLRENGIRPSSFPGQYFSAIKHTEADRMKYYPIKELEVSKEFYNKYYQYKLDYVYKNEKVPSQKECIEFLKSICNNNPKHPLYPHPIPEPTKIDIYKPENNENIYPENKLVASTPKTPIQPEKEINNNVADTPLKENNVPPKENDITNTPLANQSNNNQLPIPINGNPILFSWNFVFGSTNCQATLKIMNTESKDNGINK